MNSSIINNSRGVAYWLAGIISIESLSFLIHYIPEINNIVFVVLTTIFILVAYKKFDLAVLVALAEIFLGSHGHLFDLVVYGFELSIRMTIFSILILFSIPQIYSLRQSLFDSFRNNKSIVFAIILLGVAFLFSIGNGIIQQNGLHNVFFDSNNYLFFLFLLPLLIVQRNENFIDEVIKLLVFCSVYLAIKTVFLLYLFTHGFFQPFVVDLYIWLRDVRLGEFTLTTTGAYRIFFQSQIFLFGGWWILLNRFKDIRDVKKIGFFFLCLVTAALLVSFSRSFWLGWFGSVIVYLGWIVYAKREFFLSRIFFLTSSVLFALIVIFITVKFPIPTSTSGNFDFADRFNIGDESAASSRWNQLKPLWSAIGNHPILGSGLGTPVSYISDDPRIRAVHSDGYYSTTAFEWGYLDQWLDLGLFGVLLYLFIGVYLFYHLIDNNEQNDENLALAFLILTLFIVHLGTPYLNHPLGITILLISTAKIIYDNDFRQLAKYT